MNKHVLILGGSGFTGRALCAELLDRGFRVSGLQRNAALPDGIRPIPGDLTTFDWNLLNADLPDTIIHLARIPGRSRPGRYLAGLKGKKASLRLIRWLKTLENPPHLIFASGTLVYGSHGIREVPESTPLHPISFQRDYVKAELPFLDQMRKGGLPITVVRLPWIIGPDSWFRQFWVEPARKTGHVMCYGTGDQLMSLIHVADCASQIAEAAVLRELTAGSVCNLMACQPITQKEFVRITAGLLGAGIRTMDADTLGRTYGKAVREALTFSVHSVSTHDFVNQHPNRFPVAADAIAAAIRDVAMAPGG